MEKFYLKKINDLIETLGHVRALETTKALTLADFQSWSGKMERTSDKDIATRCPFPSLAITFYDQFIDAVMNIVENIDEDIISIDVVGKTSVREQMEVSLNKKLKSKTEG